MPGMPVDPFKENIQKGILDDRHLITSRYSSECWNCKEPCYQYRVKADSDMWRCKCGVEWATPFWRRQHWMKTQPEE